MFAARLLLLLVFVSALAACAGTPEDRGPWHQWLHEHGME